MNDMSKLEKLLRSLYGLTNISLHSLNSDSGKLIYCVEQEHRQTFILHAYPLQHNKSLLELIAILSFLEAQGYPSERIVTAKSGTITTAHDGWQFLLTTYIAGVPADYALPTLYKLGAALGHLHTLYVPPLNTTHPLPQAEMLPQREITYAVSQLRNAEQFLPGSLYRRYDEITAALYALDLCDNLPSVLIHNDAHPGNAICTPTGQTVFIDWEGAGLGPAVIDLGFLLASCDTPSPWTPPLSPDPKRVEAIVAGYCEHHLLTSTELKLLPDAIRFRALVFGAASFASAIREYGGEDQDQWWWARYEAAEDIAERAEKCIKMIVQSSHLPSSNL
jgi:Ser/Thr protein kinase RdoA (MazF antagonist)